ncbi:MAG TPA: polyprenyl synthetase family protein [Verrucomicrobiae bacterium]|nr:polyprenyl synthetase family protein [Verrucomicrobiae bacterium]
MLTNVEALAQQSTWPTAEMALVEDALQHVFARSRGIIRETCYGLINSGGKRIRPLLTLTSSLCFGPVRSEAIYAAVAAELVHMASLVHDDVIDRSEIRRGQATVNSLVGNSSAVLAGDYIFAEAFNLMSSHKLYASMNYLVEAIQQMCDGEVNQAGETFVTTVNREKYLCRIAKKTGILLAACCKSGAATAGASETEIFKLGQYGLNVGYAFQIVDDILDFTGTPEVLGKPIGLDVKNGNVTLPVILLMDNPVYGPWVKQVLDTQQVNNDGLASIKEALFNTGSIERAYGVAETCIENAKQSLEQIPDSEYKTTLLGLADKVLKRDN